MVSSRLVGISTALKNIDFCKKKHRQKAKRLFSFYCDMENWKKMDLNFKNYVSATLGIKSTMEIIYSTKDCFLHCPVFTSNS